MHNDLEKFQRLRQTSVRQIFECAVERCAFLVGANPTQQLSLQLVAAQACHVRSQDLTTPAGRCHSVTPARLRQGLRLCCEHANSTQPQSARATTA